MVSPKNFSVFKTIPHSLILIFSPRTEDGKRSPQHDSAITMPHSGDSNLEVIRGVGYMPHAVFSLMKKRYVAKFNFSLIWTECFLPHTWGVSLMLFSEHLWRSIKIKQLLFFATLWKNPFLWDLKGSYGQTLWLILWSFAAPSVLSSAFSVTFLINAPVAWSVDFGGVSL